MSKMYGLVASVLALVVSSSAYALVTINADALLDGSVMIEDTLNIQTTNEVAFSTALNWLHAEGLTMYTTEAEFRGSDSITRGEASKFVSQYGAVVDLEGTYDNCMFLDIANYDETLVPHIKIACELGILKGSDNMFMPDDSLTEAQAVTLVVRTLFGFQDETKIPWYTDYYTIGQEIGLITTEDMQGVASTPISRAKLGTWFYLAAMLHAQMDDSNTDMDQMVGNEDMDDNMMDDTMNDEEMNENMEDDMNEEDDMMTPQGIMEYSDAYLEAALEAGQRVVLYFAADRCPLCNALDEDIEMNEAEIPENVVILKIDYDTETELKQDYDIISQHTLVYLDGEGEVAFSTTKTAVTLNELLTEMEMN